MTKNEMNWKKTMMMMECVRDTISLSFLSSLSLLLKAERPTKDDDDAATAATGRGDAPSPSGTGERVRARVLLDGAGKVLQKVRLETVERAERVREEVSRTVHGEIRGRDENDQPSGAETIQPRRRRRRVIL